jgi:type II secretory pathway pseudopilin PulG
MESIIVIGILGVLFCLLMPAVQRVRQSAERVKCQYNIKQNALALHNYESQFGFLPPHSSKKPNDPNNIVGWMGLILPQMDRGDLYAQVVSACDISNNPLNNPPHIARTGIVKSFFCPSDPRLGSPAPDIGGLNFSYTSYVGVLSVVNKGEKNIYPGALSGIINDFSSISDGLSQTVFFGERPPPANYEAGHWYPIWSHFIDGTPSYGRGPNNVISIGSYDGFQTLDRCTENAVEFGPGRLDNPCDRFHMWSLHTQGAYFAMCDGSVQFFQYTMPRQVFHALCSKNGNEIAIFDP